MPVHTGIVSDNTWHCATNFNDTVNSLAGMNLLSKERYVTVSSNCSIKCIGSFPWLAGGMSCVTTELYAEHMTSNQLEASQSRCARFDINQRCCHWMCHDGRGDVSGWREGSGIDKFRLPTATLFSRSAQKTETAGDI